MRDIVLITKMERFEKTTKVLFEQFTFLETRQRAYEEVLSRNNNFASIKADVDSRHELLLNEAHQKMVEAVVAADAEAKKPRLVRVN